MTKAGDKDTAIADAQPVCGIVRPIADMEDYTSTHWEEVHSIVREAAEAVGYKTRLVSENESVGVILGNIVANLYNDPIIICDVSGKNPNVMFELGMRIAFEKPVIIIADDTTGYSFDIAPVKHLKYPKTLRYDRINSFKSELGAAIVATIEAHDDKSHKGYLQQFGPIKVAELATRELDTQTIVSGMAEMGRAIRAIENTINKRSPEERHPVYSNRVVIRTQLDVDSPALRNVLRSFYQVMKVPFQTSQDDEMISVSWPSSGSLSKDKMDRKMLAELLKPFGEVV